MSTLTDKFQIKPSMKGGVFRCPSGVKLPFPPLKNLRGKDLDYAIVFVTNVADVSTHAAAAVSVIKEDGILWFCYPKRTGKIRTDIHRDTGWQPVLDLGFQGCRQIAVDETWSALRFREPRFSRKR